MPELLQFLVHRGVLRFAFAEEVVCLLQLLQPLPVSFRCLVFVPQCLVFSKQEREVLLHLLMLLLKCGILPLQVLPFSLEEFHLPGLVIKLLFRDFEVVSVFGSDFFGLFGGELILERGLVCRTRIRFSV